MAVDSYLFVIPATLGGELDATRLRGYAIADAEARFRRARGEDVLLALGVDGFARPPKPAAGEAVADWAAAGRDRLRARLAELGMSFDYERTADTSDPAHYRWSQLLFVRLLEADLVYQRGGRGWFLRTSAFNEENDRRLDELDGWTDAARAAQRELLRRVDGQELEARALDGTPLELFTAHPERIGEAEFVGLSPSRPEIDRWTGGESAEGGVDADELRRRVEELRNRDWSGTPDDQLPVVEVGMSAQVPGVPQPLPILVSPSIDVRFGPAATVGIPGADPADKALARDLPKLGGLAWKTDAKPPRTAPAVRFLAQDMPLSRGRAWGAPVPVVHCEACGAVALSADVLPLEPPADVDVTARGNPLADSAEFMETSCPRCDGPARRDAGTLHPRFGAAWLVLALAVPPAARAEAMLEHEEVARRLPTARTVVDAGASAALLDARTVAKALRDAGALTGLDDGEPHGPTLMHAPLELEGAGVEELIAAHGGDAVRFALLLAAAPERRFAGDDAVVRQAAGFLADLRAFAEPRLSGAPAPDARIDAGDGLRRRLARWCDTAVERSAENHERAAMHRATRNAIELLARIQDFERRVAEHRDVAGPDREAVAIALGVLLRLLAPLAPTVADELWRAAGHPGTPAEAAWPALQREPTPA